MWSLLTEAIIKCVLIFVFFVDSGRYNPAIPKDAKVKRLFVTDGSLSMAGSAVVVYRLSNKKAIDMRNINEVSKNSDTFLNTIYKAEYIGLHKYMHCIIFASFK